MSKEKLINDALMLAIKAHGAKRRKYTGELYVTHPIAVSRIIETVEHTPEMIAAALLHDVIEDTKVTLNDIEDRFGPKVSMFVHYCTNISEKKDGNREFRKKMDIDHFALGPRESQTIKVADMLHNSVSIIKYDQKFFHSTYKHEKQYMLKVLTKADPFLLEQANKILIGAWNPSV
jgi:(p)ppGpp synthase/HD superfamily hydrolase